MSYTSTIMIPEMGFQAVSCTFDNLVNIHEVTKKKECLNKLALYFKSPSTTLIDGKVYTLE